MADVFVPELGEDIEKATCACWHAKVGDQVRTDDDIVELVTDKATFNVSAGANGILKEALVKEGQDVKIGAKIATIE